MTSILFEIACDFLIRGTSEPLCLSPDGAAALSAGVELCRITGALEEGIEEILALIDYLEGRGDSPGAAQAIREAMAAVPSLPADRFTHRTARRRQRLLRM
jgi:hypothetical protein